MFKMNRVLTKTTFALVGFSALFAAASLLAA
jgi:hypothetical protein